MIWVPLFTFLFVVFPEIALAYLDPGTIGYFIQLLVATLAGVGFAVKIFWKNIRMFFAAIFSRGGSGDSRESDEKPLS